MNMELIKGVWREIRKHYDDPFWWKKATRYYFSSLVHRMLCNQGGIDVPMQDWDNLIILDACRADLFEETIDFDRKNYKRIISRGSTTIEWLEKNFKGRKFYDTIYVTANPFVSLKVGDSFYKIVEVWKTAFDEKVGTVLPKDVMKYALKSFKEDKRLIVHFMQPHYPFITIKKDWRDGLKFLTMEALYGSNYLQKTSLKKHPIDVFEALQMGLIDKNKVWKGYKSNLELVWKYVRKLIEKLSGKTVVTSDHGEMIGERILFLPIRGYGHPRGIRNPELIEVPWLEFDGERRKIKAASHTELEKNRIQKSVKKLTHRIRV